MSCLVEMEYPASAVATIADRIRGESPGGRKGPMPTLLGGLPIPSRQGRFPPACDNAEAQKPAPATGMPCLPIMTRRGVPTTASMTHPTPEPRYVIGSVLTPVRQPASKLRSGKKHTSLCSTDTLRLPLWVRSGTRSIEQSPASMTPLSLSSYLPRSNSDGSLASLKWAPEVFVQAWHRALSESYDIVSVVGEGRSGAVFIVRHKRNEKHFACKFLQKVDHNPEALQNEVYTLRRLDHPNIVRPFEVLEDSDTVFLLMELCAGGELFDRIDEEGHLSEASARTFAQQMLSALAYCHANGVVHGDIKPENFLLETADPDCSRLKLADFGVATCIRPAHVCPANPSRQWSFESGLRWSSSCDDLPAGQKQGTASELRGSLPYMAPELFRARSGANASTNVLAASDLWSCGVTIYVMLSGEFPFGDKPASICSGNAPSFTNPVWQDVSEESLDLLRGLLNPIAEQRLTAQQALQHAWFRDTPPGGSGDLLLSSGNSVGLSTSSSSLASAEGRAEVRREYAVVLLRNLRTWRQMPKLRRIVISAIAKRLDAEHEMHRIGQGLYNLFGDTTSTLRCDALASSLAAALRDAQSYADAGEHEGGGSGPTGGGGPRPSLERQYTPDSSSPRQPPALAHTATGGSTTPSPGSRALRLLRMLGPDKARCGRSVTGLGIRQRLGRRLRGLGHVTEERGTPTPTPTTLGGGGHSSSSSPPGNTSRPSAASGGSLGEWPSASALASPDSGIGAPTDEKELRHLVASLDATKNGLVDYTLLMAAMLSRDVYSDEQRIADAFHLFNVHGHGAVGPEDLCKALRGGASCWVVSECSAMLAEFDRDGDGALDFKEFRAMVRGRAAD